MGLPSGELPPGSASRLPGGCQVLQDKRGAGPGSLQGPVGCLQAGVLLCLCSSMSAEGLGLPLVCPMSRGARGQPWAGHRVCPSDSEPAHGAQGPQRSSGIRARGRGGRAGVEVARGLPLSDEGLSRHVDGYTCYFIYRDIKEKKTLPSLHHDLRFLTIVGSHRK